MTAAAQTSPASGGTDQHPLAIDDLRAPTSPAFILLDVTPASVDRPQTPKALTLNLLSALNSSTSGFPKNYALEIAPYWLASHPTLTFSDYYGQRDLGNNLARTFAVSIATAPLAAAGTIAAGTHVGIGVRAMVLQGTPNPFLKKLRADLNDADTELLKIQDEGLRQLRLEIHQQTRELERATDPAAKAAIQQHIRDLEQQLATAGTAKDAKWTGLMNKAKAVSLQIQGLDAQRVGFMIAIAEGEVWDFPGDQTANGSLSRWGAWITPAYRVRTCDDRDDCQSAVDFIVVFRYLSDRASTGTTNKWDAGGRVLWQATKQLAVSAEMLRRSSAATPTNSSNRTTGIAEYRLRDDLLLFASFGRNFDDAPDHKTLTSLFGLNIGFGQKPVIDMSR